MDRENDYERVYKRLKWFKILNGLNAKRELDTDLWNAKGVG